MTDRAAGDRTAGIDDAVQAHRAMFPPAYRDPFPDPADWPPPEPPTGDRRRRPPRTVQDVWASLSAPAALAVLIALLTGAVVAFAGAEYERSRTPVYQSAAVLLLDNPAAIDADPGWLVGVSQARAKYAGLADTEVIAGPAARTLGKTESYVAGRVRATLDISSLNIDVIAAGNTPAQSQAVANAVAAQLVTYVTDEQAHLPNTVNFRFRMRMQLVSAAQPGARISPRHSKEETTGVVYGVLALIVSYVVAQLTIDARSRQRARRPLTIP